MKRIPVFVVALLLAVAPALAGGPGKLKAGVFDPPRAAPGFVLSGTTGKELKLSDYRGKVVLLGFGFTSCKDVCPVTLATLAAAHKKLGAQAKDVQVLYITVDPARDDVPQLKRYLTAFNPSFVGGTGTEALLRSVRSQYGIEAKRVVGGINHSSFIYMIDRKGKLRALMPFDHPADDYVNDIRLLLAAS